jgi:hypothetical protein
MVCGWRKRRQDDVLTRRVPVDHGELPDRNRFRYRSRQRLFAEVFHAKVVKPLRLRPRMHRYWPRMSEPTWRPCR